MYLSEDILFCIIDYLDRHDLIIFNCLSKSINEYTNKNKFWYRFYLEKFNSYLFETDNQNWKLNFISVSKLSSLFFKILRKISISEIDFVQNNIKYSNLNKIYWNNLDKKSLNNMLKVKVRTIVNNHKKYGYFITSIFLIDYDKIYYSVYFVNNSESYDIFYNIKI